MTRPGRQHGRPSTYGNGCRCVPCRRAWADRANRVRLAKLRGEWQPWVQAQPVRDYVRGLLEAGLTMYGLAAAARVSVHTVTHLLGGTPTQGLAAPTRIRPATAARLLAVRPPGRQLPPAGTVDGTGTHRRVQALLAMGWSYAELARRMELPYATVRNLAVLSGRVMAGNAARVRDAYDALGMLPGPSGQARALAARRAWVVPLAWDDDTIDDPAARPQGVRPPSTGRDVVADSEELLDQGYTLAQAADQLRVARGTLERARLRRGLRLTGRRPSGEQAKAKDRAGNVA